MVDPAAGPFLFDTSAEGWLARNASPHVVRWLYAYLGLHQAHLLQLATPSSRNLLIPHEAMPSTQKA